MSNIKTSLLRETVKLTEAFIRDVNSARIDPSGELVLSIEHLDRESGIIDALHAAVRGVGNEVWTRVTIAELFSVALHDALGIGLSKKMDFTDRLQDAMAGLDNTLQSSIRSWELVFPILGVRVPPECYSIGNVDFYDGSEENLNALCNRVDDIMNESPHTEEEKAQFRLIFQAQIRGSFKGTAIAIVKVGAAEKRAAQHLAQLDILQVIDILNFFSIALYPRDLRVRIHLLSEARGDRHLHLLFDGDESFSMNMQSEGSIEDFDLAALDESKSIKLGLARMRTIMSKSGRSEVDRSIINAARIAGKAHLAFRREDSFLLFAISIESVIVGGDEKLDLTYKLSTRCAHLLGKDLASRLRISDEIKKLYGIRSAIVHRGHSGFPDEELLNIRRYALRIIRTFLLKEEFYNISRKADLSAWFNEKMLA